MGADAIHLPTLRQRTLGNETLMADLLSLFRAHAPPRLASIQDATARGDLAAARETIHQLKSSATTIAADRLAALLRAAEQQLNAGDLPAVRSSLPVLESELDACLKQIDALTAGCSTG